MTLANVTLDRRHFVRLGLGALAPLGLGGALSENALAASKTAEAPAPKPAPTPTVSSQRHWAEGDMVLGQPNAPVTVIEYASMTCTHCAQFEVQTLPAFEEKYIKPGKVKLIFREFPLDGLALRAAMLARCAGRERYFGVLELLFRQQEKWAQAPDPLAALARIGLIAGVPKQEFDACMADKELMDHIVQGRLDAEKSYRIESTPTFIIAGKTHSGALTMEQLDKILQPLLAKSS